jgi:hypothetical protein
MPAWPISRATCLRFTDSPSPSVSSACTRGEPYVWGKSVWSTLIPTQPRELRFLDAGQSGLTPALVSVGLGHPIPRTRLRNEILRHLSDRFGPLTGQLNSTTTDSAG